MKWRKLGRVFCPSGEFPWLMSHAAVPIAEYIGKDNYRIYFSSRDTSNRSHTGWVEINLKQITKQSALKIKLSEYPVLKPGKLGCFDDSGAMASWLVKQNNKQGFMYYIGWNLGVTVPFRNAIGVAVTQDGEIYKKYFEGPIIDRTPYEPHFCASCCVYKDDDRWRMWYLSCVGWENVKDHPHHQYHIKYAESSDGIRWYRPGIVAIDFSCEYEYAISRPSVIKDADRWKMWYSFRAQEKIDTYRIGYAESVDAINWERKDHLAGIDISPSGWDSEMIEYPFVFDHDGERYMLYNGNDYGRTGFGLAILEQD